MEAQGCPVQPLPGEAVQLGAVQRGAGQLGEVELVRWQQSSWGAHECEKLVVRPLAVPVPLANFALGGWAGEAVRLWAQEVSSWDAPCCGCGRLHCGVVAAAVQVALAVVAPGQAGAVQQWPLEEFSWGDHDCDFEAVQLLLLEECLAV